MKIDQKGFIIINPISGCYGPGGAAEKPNRCYGCYAHHIAEQRLRGRFGYPEDDPFKPTFHPDKLEKMRRRRKPMIYFFCSMGDWLDDAVEREWREKCLEAMAETPQHRYITLTKQYSNLGKIRRDSPNEVIPPNVAVGISVTNRKQVKGIDKLVEVEAAMRFISFEPLLEDVSDLVDLEGVDWIIIGARTRQGSIPPFIPEKQWVQRLVEKARNTMITMFYLPSSLLKERDVPVFLKPNLGNYVEKGWFDEKLEQMPDWIEWQPQHSRKWRWAYTITDNRSGYLIDLCYKVLENEENN